MAEKDIKNFTKYPSLSDNDYLLGTKTDLEERMLVYLWVTLKSWLPKM